VISSWINAITIWFGTLGYWGVFLSCLGLFPAEIVIAMVGASMPNKLTQVALVAAVGETIGALPTYLVGFLLSKKDLLHFINGKGKFLNISTDSYNHNHKSIKKGGAGYLFISRFIPWTRTISGLVAGFVRYNILIFLLIAFVGTFIYAYGFAYLGAKIGSNWEKISSITGIFNNGMLLLTVLVVVVYVIGSKKKNSKK